MAEKKIFQRKTNIVKDFINKEFKDFAKRTLTKKIVDEEDDKRI